MPPSIGTGEPAPVDPSSDAAAARALAAYERRLAAVDAAPWRATAGELAEAERYHAALEDREPAAWTLDPDERRRRAFLDNATPDELARFELGAYYWQAALAEAGPSLDTWELLDIGNSPEPPAPARDDSPVPLGQGLPQADWQADRVRRYDRAKADLGPAIRAAAGALAELDPDAPGPAILDRMAEAIGGCREVRVFREAVCGAHAARPMSCDVRLCPDCERRRSAAFLERLASVRAGMARPVHVTLTVPNVPPGFLGLGTDILLDAWGRLRRTALLAGGYCRSDHQDPDERRAGELPPHRERCKHPTHREPAARACASCNRRHGGRGSVTSVPLSPRGACGSFVPSACACARCVECRRCHHAGAAGGVASLEVTYSPERGDWHPHLHLVADLADYVPHAELRAAWRAASCDAYRAGLDRAPDHGGRGAGYRRPASLGRVKLTRCRHLADRNGRPADMVCAAGHGWRAVDADRCPYQDRDMAAPCGVRGELIPEPDRCRGASHVWIARAKDAAGRDDTAAALREAIKYATKGVLGRDGSIAPAILAAPLLLAELLLTLRGRRLVNGWGSYHGITDDAPEEPTAGDELVAVDTGELYDRLGNPIPAMLPRTCPSCGGEALWEYLGRRRRADCVPKAGQLYWRPPAPPGRVN